MNKIIDAGHVAAARHEAAHAVVGMVLRYRVPNVKIWHENYIGWRGFCHAEMVDHKDHALRDAVLTVAGYAAMSGVEGIIAHSARSCGGGWYRMTQGDQADFDRLVPQLTGFKSAFEAQEECTKQAREFLYNFHPELEAITYALLERSELNEEQLQQLVGELATRWQLDVKSTTQTSSNPATIEELLASRGIVGEKQKRIAEIVRQYKRDLGMASPSSYRAAGMRHSDAALIERR